MKRAIGLLAVLLLASGVGWAQVKEQRLGDLARKVRAERAGRDLSKIPFFTNETLPGGTGGVSFVGTSRAAVATEGGEEGAAGAAAAAGGEKQKCDEACWRGKFSEKRNAIAAAQTELDILQREFNLARTQYYQDPNQAVREQYSANTAGGRQLQDLQQRINDKQAQIQRLQGELSALEDQLRREGGNPGWARP
jgi:hypothetical protein